MTQDPNPLQARLSLLVPINNLQPRQQEQLLAGAEILTIRKKDYVFRQGDRDDFSFYLIDGELEMYAADQLIKKIAGGEGASFYPLAQLQPRQMSARATTNAQVLRLNRRLLDQLLSAGQQQSEPPEPLIEVEEFATTGEIDWLTTMLQSELFARIPASNIQRLIDTLEVVTKPAGDTIIKQGDTGDFYYAIQSGSCGVYRATSHGKEIRLAELGPGDTFGEEALVSNATRNATVRMLTDGKLGRLTKENFIELIRTPVLRTVPLAEARAMVAAGAKWLDVRFPEEHRANGLPDSVNLPLSFLRARVKELDREQQYIVYCDSGGRSSAASFLLAQLGFEVWHIADGAIDELGKEAPVPAATASQSTVAAMQPATASAEAQRANAIIEADVRAQSLAADLEKAKIQIEQARRLMLQAQTAKRDAEQFVLQKLQAERSRIDHDAEVVQARLLEAQRLKDEIERRHQAALAEVEQRRREQEAHAAALRRAAEEKLQQEKERLEAIYRSQTDQLDQLHAEQLQSKRELEQAWKQIETESTVNRERLKAAKRLEQAIQEREREQQQRLKKREDSMREALRAELARERQKLEAEFANNAAELARVRQQQQAAEAAKQAAAAETQRIIEEYKASQQRLLAEQEAKRLAERRQLEAQAAAIQQQMAAAIKAKTDAEAAQRAAEQQLAEARRRLAAAAVPASQARSEIAAIETRAQAAALQWGEAVAAETAAEAQRRENDQNLEHTYDAEGEINQLLQKELEEWVMEQDRIQNATAHRAELRKQKAQADRIKQRATEAQQAAQTEVFSLLDEIERQLGE